MELNHWSKCEEKVDLILNLTVVFSKGSIHLSITLGVTNEGDLVDTRGFSDEINLSWDIVLTETVKRVVEELGCILIWVDLGVLPAVNVTPVVSKPDIITKFGKLESW